MLLVQGFRVLLQAYTSHQALKPNVPKHRVRPSQIGNWLYSGYDHISDYVTTWKRTKLCSCPVQYSVLDC